MIFILFTIVLMAAGAALAPDTPLGGLLHRALIEAPARWLNDAGPIKLAVALGVILLVIAAPEMALFTAADLSLFLEALAADAVVATQIRVRKVLHLAVRAALAIPRRFAPRARARAPGRRILPPSKADEDPAMGWSPAFA